jgi:hypothetical protein
MREVVEHIPVLRKETRVCRSVIICADDSGEILVRNESLHHPADRVRVDTHIGIDEYEDICRRMLDAAIPCPRRPAGAFDSEVSVAKAVCQGLDRLGGPVIYHQHVKVHTLRPSQSL